MTRSSGRRGQPALGRTFFERDAALVARDLIGVTLLVSGVGGRIVEVEAYDQDDAASHSHRGVTPRNAVMFGEPGHLYVYLIYGLRCCLNIVCGPAGSGSAVLIRALEPQSGINQMFARRDGARLHKLCAGPGRLCQALDIDLGFNGLAINRPPIEMLANDDAPDVAVGPRVGISKAKETAWRFSERGSAFLSRPVSLI